MLVLDVMTANPVTVEKTAPLCQALELMELHECHHLPVLSADHSLIGILTDGDCYRAMGRTKPDLPPGGEWCDDPLANRLLVRDAMTAAPIVAERYMPLVNAVRLMQRNHISCLPVMQGETLVGIMTTFDILTAFMRVLSAENE
jgi:acetoin utilization protein AcuB